MKACTADSIKGDEEDYLMDKPMSNLGFRLMSCIFVFRDLLLPRKNVLEEAGIREGSTVLDYGCGPGGYVAAASGLVGESGKVYALDMHPLAIDAVRRMASRKRLSNVETIRSGCPTGLPDDSVDVVLLYDILHLLSDPDRVLQELHRVLKADGILSFSDHHMKEEEIALRVSKAGLFRLLRKGSRTHSFAKEGSQESATATP
jgi:ubiquinone/menaquinone biosynthesis C-methylase UbiE